MQMILLTVGKPKTAYINDGLADYAKRLQPAGGLKPAHVKPALAGKGKTAPDLMALEGERLLAQIKPRDGVWALDRQGRELASTEWARELEKARAGGFGRLVLVIGGAEGLDQAVLSRADLKLSFGPLTLPHELAALVAAEQLYRAASILAGSPYHR